MSNSKTTGSRDIFKGKKRDIPEPIRWNSSPSLLVSCTQEHINKGLYIWPGKETNTRWNKFRCPLCKAIIDTVEYRWGDVFVRIDEGIATIVTAHGAEARYKLPGEANQWYANFDNGLHVRPITFTIKLIEAIK